MRPNARRRSTDLGALKESIEPNVAVPCAILSRDHRTGGEGATYGISIMELMVSHPLVRFLKEDLGIPASSIALAVQQSEQTPSLLPMVLWQYGLITLTQLDQIFDWLEKYDYAA
jgi:Protein of unknown function (DUF2949)